MAISSLSATLPMLPVRNSSLSSKPNSPFLSFCCPSNAQKPHQSLKSPFSISLSSRHFRAFASPELLDSTQTTESTPEALDVPDSIVLEDGGSEFRGSTQIDLGADASAMAPKQKIRIKLKSYYVRFIEDAAKQIMDAARTTNAKTVGPVPLPTKRRIYCVLKSPHVHKDARFHFEIRTHQRLIDIHYPTAQTIDALMQLDLPPAVDVQVKL
ncbi:hypothetical protein AAC387_Pa03g1857 [Persea americana]